jgi:hypothetical protein
VAFSLETFKGGSPKIFFIGFAIADQLSNAWIAGLLSAKTRKFTANLARTNAHAHF